MGSKTRARELMREAGVPIVPGTTEPVATVEDAREIIDAEIGYPVAVKAAGGGGGKGFRVALSEDELQAAFEGAAREGEKFFSDPTVYLERYLPDPRHVEVQVLADRHGNTIHLGERDCSVQRRHQKLIEESPAPAVDEALRERIGKIGVEAARAVGYVGAGTIEGLLSEDGEYFFLEMNTRVQVEHCVTEMTTGVDIVKEGIRAAAGEPLSVGQDDVVLRGHAIECRINAEDASKNFAPAPGRIGDYREPAGPGVRVDSGVGPGSEITPMYDPMVAKLIVWDADREQATKRMLRALAEYEIEGLKTLIPFHTALLATEQWARRRDVPRPRRGPRVAQGARVPRRAEGRRRRRRRRRRARLHGRGLRPPLRREGHRPAGGARRQRHGARRASGGRDRRRARGRGARAVGRRAAAARAATRSSPRCRATCGRCSSSRAQTVEEGQLVCIIEAMKMENEITAHKAGVISELAVKEGEPITSGATIAVISSSSSASSSDSHELGKVRVRLDVLQGRESPVRLRLIPHQLGRRCGEPAGLARRLTHRRRGPAAAAARARCAAA